MKKIVLSIIVALIAITANAQVYVGMGHRTKRFFQWSGKMGERF